MLTNTNSNDLLTSQRVTDLKQLEHLKDFLRTNQLPADDITLDNSSFILYMNSNNEIIGSGGLEYYNGFALLRSLAVSQNSRGHLVGNKILNELLALAREQKIKEVYLLTNTAFFFFLKFGFKEVAREEVHDAVKTSSQFTSVCPSSARVMKLVL